MNLIPCTRFTSNSPLKQFLHILSELFEVAVALIKGDIPHVAEEIIDTQTALETLLVIIGYNSRKRAAVRRIVADKNSKRKYFEVNK